MPNSWIFMKNPTKPRNNKHGSKEITLDPARKIRYFHRSKKMKMK
jgi:hypothetical protein